MRFHAYQVAGLMLGMLALTACSDSEDSSGQAVGAGAPPPTVTVSTPLVREVRDWDNYVGHFEAVERVDVRPRVTGYLVEVGFEDGAQVEEGDPLFRIDPRPFEAALSAAESRVRGAQTRLSNATTELERATGLRDFDAISQEEFDTLSAVVDTAQSDLEAAQAAVEIAQLDLDFTTVNAPVSGRVSSRRVDVGNVVRADDTLLTTIVSIDPIHFKFDASESLYLSYLRGNRDNLLGSPVRIRLQGESNHERQGELDFIDNMINTSAGTIQGRAVVDNPDGFLSPGMFGHMQLQATAPYQGILMPDTAISTRGAQRIVFKVDDNNIVSSHIVELGPMDGGLRVIRSGLDAQDRVVINGIQRAIPGSPVTPQAGNVEDFAQ